ncbi:BspA family leucine-rich repeat surface protein [Bombilactobacillus mellis]|uniref:BspA family leucine-rich repeat surface protein n=1 Tax=Bombilactobacillus mellis TaxID=1218508 RepID=UPI0022482AA9|nr:BspA family leucine-rich repeat surface protein [Bombilactobacillus mellis]MCX0279640.1 BspA family leucine-rich repeat surface protein [Bombilactobacillus mellis]
MKKFVKIHHFLIRSLSAGQKFISLLLNYKVLSVQLGIFLGLLLINANYFACLNIKAATTSTLEEVINPSYLDMNSSTGSVQFNSPIKQVNTTSEIQVSAVPQLQQPNISPLIQVITVPPLLRSNSDYEKTGTDQPTKGDGWHFDKGTLTLGDEVDGTLKEPDKDSVTGKTIWPWEGLRSQVTKVEIKNEVKINTASSMFANMPQLSTVNGLNKLDSIKYMNAMFEGDSSLEKLIVKDWNLSNVSQCSYLFSYCTSLNDIEIEPSKDSAGKPQLPFQSTISMSAMFYHCTSLKSVDVSDWDVGNVTNFFAMFKECFVLQSIKGLDNWNTTNAIDMSSMFYNCNALTNVDVSKWDVKNVKNFSSMFRECSALQSIKGLDNWNTTKATDMSSMFYNCTDLTSIASSNPGENPSTNVTSTSASENLGNLDFSNFRTANVQNFSYMFFACKALRSIKGLDNWNTTAATDMSYMFAYDDNLNSLDLSKFDTSQVTTFQTMFAVCEKLTSIAGLNNWNTTKANNMSSMFAYDSSLQKLDLSSFDTTNATQNNFFSGDNKLWYLKIGKYTQLKDDCGLPEAPKDTYFPSEFPKEPENPKNPEYKTSQNGKWQKVIKKEEDDYWWQPNDDIYTNDEVIKDSQSNDSKFFIWQPAFSQTTKGSLVLNVSPSQINFDIILDTNNNILGNNNKSSYSAEANSDLEYTVQNPQGESWQLYAMMTKFKKKSNSDSEINSGAMSLSLNEGSENGKQHPLNQQPTSIRTSADNSLEWALKPVLNINISGLNGIPKAGSSYTTTIDYDLVNSIQ